MTHHNKMDQESALLGHKTIGLSYPNSWDVKDLCMNQADCFGAVREELFTGEHNSL